MIVKPLQALWIFVLSLTCVFCGCSRRREGAQGTAATQGNRGVGKYEKLVDDLRKSIESSDGGLIEIPDAVQAQNVVRRRVFVTKAGDSKAVLFPTWIGKGSNMRGYLWVRGNLADFMPSNDHGQLRINILVPAPTEKGTARMSVTLTARSEKDWYAVTVEGD